MINLPQTETDLFSKQELQNLVDTSFSIREISRKIKVDRKVIKTWIERYEIDTDKWKNIRNNSKLKIIETFYKTINDKKRKYALCQCICGKIKEVRHDGIGKTVFSCGCLLKSSYRDFKNLNSKLIKYNVTTGYFNELKSKAKKRGIEFSINIEDAQQVYEKQDKKCVITGEKIWFSSNYYYQTASLDRINSNIGYNINNIQWINKDINMLKSNFDQDYFLELCTKIVNFQKESEKK